MYDGPSPSPGNNQVYCLKKLWVGVVDTVTNRVRDKTEKKGGRLYLEAELFFEKDSTAVIPSIAL